MSGPIKDGRGTDEYAKVDDHGRLWVSANMIDHKQHHALYHMNLFLIPCTVTTAGDGSTEATVLFIKNLDSSRDYELYDIDTCCTSDVEIQVYFDDEYSSGGVVAEPINSNRASGNAISTSSMTVYKEDPTVTTANRVTGRRSQVGAYGSGRNFKYDGGLVLPAGRSMTITAKDTGSVSKVGIELALAFHSAGTTL